MYSCKIKKMVLAKLISGEHKGFLKGRYIGENIRLLYDPLLYTNKTPSTWPSVDGGL